MRPSEYQPRNSLEQAIYDLQKAKEKGSDREQLRQILKTKGKKLPKDEAIQTPSLFDQPIFMMEVEERHRLVQHDEANIKDIKEFMNWFYRCIHHLQAERLAVNEEVQNIKARMDDMLVILYKQGALND